LYRLPTRKLVQTEFLRDGVSCHRIAPPDLFFAALATLWSC